MQTYSFSRLTTWHSCKLSFQRQYVLGHKGEDNWFSRFGTLAHDIFEKVDRGLLLPEGSFQEWISRYDSEVLLGGEHEEKWMDGWQRDAEKFFAGFKGWKSNPIWIEEHVHVRSSYEHNGESIPFMFQGFVDRLGMTADKGFSMQDYKCSKVYTGATLKEKQRQMYLYSAAVKNRLGEFPKTLIFYHFRQKVPVTIPFNMDDYKEAWEWAANTVREIETYEGDYPLTANGYFCKAICNFRNDCVIHNVYK